MSSLNEIAHDFVGILDELEAPYAVVGGLAVRIHALPRPTFDVDFTALLPREMLPDLNRVAAERGLIVPQSQASGWFDAVAGLPVVKFQWFVQSQAIDIDVFLAETAFQQKLLERRVRHAVNGWDAWFATAEDLIVLKLIANRPKDRTDVSDILFIQGELDVAYMRTWATHLNVADRLEKALYTVDG